MHSAASQRNALCTLCPSLLSNDGPLLTPPRKKGKGKEANSRARATGVHQRVTAELASICAAVL